MAKNTTRIIKFKAQFEEAQGFGKWLSEIEKNIDKSVDNSFNKWIKEYKSKLDALVKTLNKAGDSPSDNVISAMHKEMKGMLDLSKKIASQFSKMSLGATSSKLEQAAAAVQNTSRQKRNAQSNARSWKNKLSIDGQTLSDTEFKRIYDKNASKGFEFNGKQFGGESGANLQAFVNEAKKDIDLLRSLNDKISQSIVQRFDEINENVKDYSDEAVQKANELKAAKEAFEAVAKGATSSDTPETNTQAVEGLSKANAFSVATDEASDAIKAHNAEIKTKTEATTATENYNKENQKTPNIVSKAAKQVFAYGTVVSLFKRILQGARRTVVELDSAFTDMAVVTNLTRQEAWGMVDDFQAIAKKTGSVTSEVAATTTKFLQQGKSLSQATQLSEAALKAAKIAGIDAARSVDLLTNAMNGFQMSAQQALEVSDKFAALAAASATDYEELAVALSKVAAQANLAGMSMDFTLGMLAKGIEVTREAPETIGTALKTVISRMRELTDFGETLEEGMDVNRVETALQNVGVQLRDSSGQFRNLEDVLSELGQVWGELNTNQQANVAVALAGTRQQSRLIAMMQDFDRTLELVDISTNSYGATMAQHAEYMGSMQAATDNLKTSYEGLISGLANADVIIGIVNGMAKIVDAGAWITEQLWLMVPIVVILASWGAKILNDKILEHQYTVAQHKLEMLKTLESNKQRVLEVKKLKTTLKQKKEDLISLRNALRENEIEEDTAEAALQVYKIKAEEAKDIKKVAEIEATINALNKEDVEQLGLKGAIDKEIKQTDAEIYALKAEENLLNTQIAASEAATNSSAQSFVSILSGIPSLLLTILGIWKAISTESVIQVGLEKLKEKFKKKNINATGKQAAAEAAVTVQEGAQTVMESAQAGAKTGGLPGLAAGLAIGLGIVAALGIAVGIAAIATKGFKPQSARSMENNIAAMQDLQAEIYNLGQTVSTVSALTDEFDTLSKKINKTAEDTKRLEEIMSEFNDTVGYEAVDASMTTDQILATMAAEEARAELEMERKIRETNHTLRQVTKTAADLQKYMQNTEGRAVIEQNLSQNYKDFGAASETTRTLILQAIKDNPTDFLGTSGGLNYKEIQNTFKASDIALIEEAISAGTLIKYKQVLKELSTETRRYIATSDSLFSHVSTMSEGLITSIDNLALTPEQLEKMSPMLTKNLSELEALAASYGGTLTKEQMFSFLYQQRTDTDTAEMMLQMAEMEKAAYEQTEEFQKYYKLRDKKPEDLTESEKDFISQIALKYGSLENAVRDAKDQVELANMSMQEFWNTFGNIPSLTSLQNEIDSVMSSTEMLSKVITGDISASELDELKTNYPALVDALQDGVLNAQEVKSLRAEMFNETAEKMQKVLADVDSQSRTLGQSLGFDWDKLKNMSAIDAESYLRSVGLSEEDYNQAIGTWRNYIQYKQKVDEFIAQGGLNEEEQKRIAESTARKLAESQYNAYKQEMELYATSDPEYGNLFGLSSQALSKFLAETAKNKQETRQAIQDRLGDYDFEILDGNIYFKNENGVIQSLDSLPREISEAFAFVPQELIEAYQEAEDAALEYASTLAEDYVQLKTEQLEKEKELIEQKKEAYEEYYEKLDALESEEERSQTRDSLIKQIAALSGGIDGASKARIKELQEQLNELEKEGAEAKREEARNMLLNNLDTHTNSLDTHIQELEEGVGSLTRSILAQGSGVQFKFNPNGDDILSQMETWLNSLGIKQFSSGGLVNYTGLAAVHGSALHPESFLNSDDTALLADVLNIMHAYVDGASEAAIIDNDDNSGQSISIENINITTKQLNSQQDFAAAGKILAQELISIKNSRGVNLNVKK